MEIQRKNLWSWKEKKKKTCFKIRVILLMKKLERVIWDDLIICRREQIIRQRESGSIQVEEMEER